MEPRGQNDIILLRDGTSIQAKVQQISGKSVKFKNESSGVKLDELPVTDIYMIKYAKRGNVFFTKEGNRKTGEEHEIDSRATVIYTTDYREIPAYDLEFDVDKIIYRSQKADKKNPQPIRHVMGLFQVFMIIYPDGTSEIVTELDKVPSYATQPTEPQEEQPQSVPGTTSTTAYTSSQSYATSQTANSHPVMTGSGAEHTVFDMTASLNWVYCVTGSGGDFKSRSCYGVTIEGASKITDSLGAGLFFSGYANYGLMDSSSAGVQFALGPTGVLSLNSSHTLGFHLPLCVGVGYVEKTNWSFITSPHFSALFNRTSVSLGCLVNVASATSASIYIGIGYQF